MVASVIVITGTPGTGKTSLGDMLKDRKINVINLQSYAIENNCTDGFDETRDSIIIDEDKLHDSLVSYLENQNGLIIIEGHYGDLVPEHFVQRCFVLTSNLNQLKKRLSNRGYSQQKINENLQAEIMKECWITAVDAFGDDRVVEISPMTQEEVFELVLKEIS